MNGRELAVDLGTIALRGKDAGLSVTEIAKLAGVTRQTCYAAMRRWTS